MLGELKDLGKLKILANGNTQQERAQKRGKIFEELMTEVLRQLGYEIDNIPNVNYAGMEIDIEGKTILNSIPLYAECKCYEANVDSPKLQAFYGKYMTRWHKDRRSQGLFIALPNVNSHAKGFYRESIESVKETAVTLLEEEDVLKAIFKTPKFFHPENFIRLIPKDIGELGDWLLLYTNKGIFYVQYIIPPGEGIPSKVVIFDNEGNQISRKEIIDTLKNLLPELEDFEIIEGFSTSEKLNTKQEKEEIVEVRGSSSCFEYQFPASPEHFVGRENFLKKVDSYVRKVVNKETSSRSILFEANSGWGKSSVVLACIARLREKKHFSVAIDSRSAASSQFILRVVDYALKKFGDFDCLISEEFRPRTITGFEGAVDTLLLIGQELKKHNKVMFIFLDQFENLFFLPDALKRVRDLFFKVQDAQSNVVLGFAWKTDLVGLTSEFPYRIRDDIATSSEHIPLDTFSKIETNALLDRLSKEIQESLRKDLKFFLSEFSQGYPWLLKKLCAHVKTQIENGAAQVNIANSLLNIEELFSIDLKGLNPEEQDTLHRIARLAPISIQELGEDFETEIIRTLVNRRLLVRIGRVYDVYWDIFRDYLNTGRVPVQENYILRMPVRSVFKVTKLLSDNGGKLLDSEFGKRINISYNTLYNILRDMRLLGVVKVEKNYVTLIIKLSIETEAFTEDLSKHLRERLTCNRLIWRILKKLEEKDKLTLSEVTELVKSSCPYISATEKTWQTYANTIVGWMDATDLAIFKSREGILSHYKLESNEVRGPHSLLARRQSRITIPPIQYAAVEKVALNIYESLEHKGVINWSGFKTRTIAKSIAALEELGFIQRKSRSIIHLLKIEEFGDNPENRTKLFAEAILKIESFNIFLKILDKYKNQRLGLDEIGAILKEKLKANWKNSTTKSNVKIMLNWLRYANLAPGVWAFNYKKKIKSAQASLFPDFEQENRGK